MSPNSRTVPRIQPYAEGIVWSNGTIFATGVPRRMTMISARLLSTALMMDEKLAFASAIDALSFILSDWTSNGFDFAGIKRIAGVEDIDFAGLAIWSSPDDYYN